MSETTTTSSTESDVPEADVTDSTRLEAAASDELEGARESDAAADLDGDDADDDDADDADDADDDGPEEAASGAEAAAESGNGSRRRPSLRRLEEEGEVAADYLEELLDIADLDGDIDIDVENDRASVAIVADADNIRDLRRLVGSNGEVLDALQELSRLAVQARTGERSRLMLDVAGHRAALRRKIEDLAARACQEVTRTGEAVRLDPMNAFERKVAHDLVAEAGLVSESEGEDPHRRVVVHPARA